jgi:endonuclease YncB( thermonuclease family)
MKKILTILALLPTLALAQVAIPKTTNTPAGVMYTAKILRVTDGDTVVMSATFLPAPLKPELAVRIYGVDTPEKGYLAKCQAEKDLGELASLFTKAAVAAATQRQVTLYTWDKYGGRVLGDIILDGKSLRQALIAQGYAREYYGTRKLSWCN